MISLMCTKRNRGGDEKWSKDNGAENWSTELRLPWWRVGESGGRQRMKSEVWAN